MLYSVLVSLVCEHGHLVARVARRPYYNLAVSPSGLHVGFLLQTVLDGPAARVQKARGRGDALGGLGVYPQHLGARHVLRKREAVLLPHRHHQQRVHPHPPLGLHHAQHQAHHHGLLPHEPAVLPHGPPAVPHRD